MPLFSNSKRIEEFFLTYKNLEPDDAEMVIESWDARDAAYDILEK